ncbi:PTS lactose transporter subunit IIB [Geodermatophilus sp. Leaf369]|jgi:mannitol-specific phosphotransferase system IIBC component|uniref:PTS lactose transporter subunit IIB n=1 Tax=Geodermatophilus sp. Leaf369 TaxID=1736354 RepID=UPI0006F2E8F2|nr:PTS lactose transporter subunit IIB [Geodermatophilus sp. Leaf369]KQS60445.1 PTS lactose transporter subunit IIB [Geodermatophilus sp. Leaf369]
MASIEGKDVRKLVIACDAGMGSSVLLANQLKKRLKSDDVTVVHSPVDAIPTDADVVLTHAKLVDRARRYAGDKPVVPFTLFVGDPAVDGLVEAIQGGSTIDG